MELTLRDVRRQGRRGCVIIQVVNRFHSGQPVYYQRWLTPQSPRAFWSDAGLAVFLAGYFSADELSKARELGAFFETMIYQHLRVICGLLTPRAKLHFWRTQSGSEVDFVVEHGRRAVGIEVKMTDAPAYRHAAGLFKFLDQHPQAVGGILLHGGRHIQRLDEKIIAVPWSLLTG